MVQKKNGTAKRRTKKKAKPKISVEAERFNALVIAADEMKRKLWVANVMLAAVVGESGGTLDVSREAIEALPEEWHLARETVDIDAQSGACSHRLTLVVGEAEA